MLVGPVEQSIVLMLLLPLSTFWLFVVSIAAEYGINQTDSILVEGKFLSCQCWLAKKKISYLVAVFAFEFVTHLLYIYIYI